MPSRSTALIGFGRMGSAFARQLCAARIPVVVFDIDPIRRAEAIELGCAAVEQVALVLDWRPGVIILSLPSEAAFATAVQGLVEMGTRDPAPIVVDTSTLGLEAKESGRRLLADLDIILLDCPVSGTAAQARRGDVVVYASGPDGAIDACEPVLRTFSREVHRMGAFGAGSKTKYLANVLVGIHNAAAAEMVALAERAGLDAARAVAVLADGAGQSRMLEVRGPAMASHNYGFGATVDLFRKDLAILSDFAASAGAYTPLLAVVAELYDRAAASGRGDDECAAVHAVYFEAGCESEQP